MMLLAVAAAFRIVSLAPALTEDLYAVGAGRQVVGVDANSNRPAAASHLPRVGVMREISAEAVLALHPDLVVGDPYEARALTDIGRGGVRTETLPVDDLRGDFAAIERLGALTGHLRSAHDLHLRIARRMSSLAARAKRYRTLTAFMALGTSDIRTAGAGTFIDELFSLANLRNVAGDVHLLWPRYSEERLVMQQPAVLILPSPHPPLAGAPWERLDAVRDGRVLDVDEDDLLRPGPRIAEVLERIIAGTMRWR